MTALDNIKAALEAGPTDGRWIICTKDPQYVYAQNAQGCLEFGLRVSSPWAPTLRMEATADFIAACNPTAIRELLAYVESLEKDAGRYRWLRSEEICVPAGQREIIVVQERMPFREDQSDEILTEGELDAAIDAAMEQTK